MSVVECKIWVESAVDCSMSRTVSQLFTCDLVTSIWSWYARILTVWFILRYVVDETLQSKNWHLASFSLLLLQVCTVWVRLPHTLLRWPFWVTDLMEQQRTSPGWAKASCMTLGVSASNLRFVVALILHSVNLFFSFFFLCVCVWGGGYCLGLCVCFHFL